MRILKLVDGFQFTEGPLWHPGGFLLFSDTPANRIYRLMDSGDVITWLDESGDNGRTHEDLSDQRGSNGLAMRGNDVIICQHGNHLLVCLCDGELRVIADEYNGRPFNSPNDLVVTRTGLIFFSDPPYGLRDQVLNKDKYQPVAGVYCFDGTTVTMITDSFNYPNGLALSADEQTLFVGSNHPDEKRLVGIDINDPRKPGEPMLVAEQNADGFKIDEHGNFWMATMEGIVVMSAEGERNRLYEVPEMATNLCFRPGSTRVYVTAGNSVYCIERNL